MLRSRVEQAVRNNAVWCDAVCRAHGAPGEFHEDLWLNRHPVPRFYSNAITLRDSAKPAALVDRIQTLLVSSATALWSVKDAFHALDLTALGLQPLFDATWLWRDPSPVPDLATEVRWSRIERASELAQWEAAWSADPGNDAGRKQPRLFPDPLLADDQIAFIAGRNGDRIVAGAILNRTDNVVGLSNVFAAPDCAASTWGGAVTTAGAIFPGLPLVGYERGQELSVARSLGFTPLGGLRVWIKQGGITERASDTPPS